MAISKTTPDGIVPAGSDTLGATRPGWVSWGAILVGVVVALAVQILLTMLGTGIGLGVLEPSQADAGASAASVSIGAAVWWAVSGIVAAFGGGWAAARLAGVADRLTGLLHGLGSWATATLVVLYLLSSAAGSIVGGAFNLVGQTVSGLGSAAGRTASALAGQAADPLQAIQDEIGAAANVNDPQAAGRQLVAAMRRVLVGEGDAVATARQEAVQIMVRQGVPQDEAQRRVAGWEEQYKQAVATATQQVREATDDAATSAVTASFYGFIALLLGAIAGAVGGRLGTPSTAVVVTPHRRQ